MRIKTSTGVQLQTNRPAWINEEYLDTQRRTLPPAVFQRFHQNLWVEGEGSFFSKSDIDGIVNPEREAQEKGK